MTERVENPPNAPGGYALVVWLDSLDTMRPVPREQAQAVAITEYDRDGNWVFETFAHVGRDASR